MKICVIGAGYVGSAVVMAHCKRNDDVVIVDPAMLPVGEIITPEFPAVIVLPEDIGDADAIYICVPTPSREDKSTDTSALDSVLVKLEEQGYLTRTGQGHNRTVVIAKSTAPPSYYAEVCDRYYNLVHVPEFLEQRNPFETYRTPPVKIVGCNNSYWAAKAIEAIEGQDAILEYGHWHMTDAQTAAAYKYLANTFLATKVTFMTDFALYAKKVGIKWAHLQDIMERDRRIGRGHTNVPGWDQKYGWGGACFPKDLDAMIAEAEKYASELRLLKDVKNRNDFHRGAHG